MIIGYVVIVFCLAVAILYILFQDVRDAIKPYITRHRQRKQQFLDDIDNREEN